MFEINLPDIPENGLMTAAQARQISEQLYALNEQLRYMFAHIGTENLTDELKETIDKGGDLSALTQRIENAEGKVLKVTKQAGELTLLVQDIDGKMAEIRLTTDGIQAAVNAGVLQFSDTGLEIFNSTTGERVFYQDLYGRLWIAGMITAKGGQIGPLLVNDVELFYANQLHIQVLDGHARIRVGNLLLKYVNSATEYGLLYGPEEAPYFAVSDIETYIGRQIRVTPSAMPRNRRGVILTYDRTTNNVGSGERIASGTVTINDSSAQSIYYGDAGFTEVPRVVASYAKTGFNASGDRGPVKVYGKTTTGATLIIAGHYPDYMEVDWIAIGN